MEAFLPSCVPYLQLYPSPVNIDNTIFKFSTYMYNKNRSVLDLVTIPKDIQELVVSGSIVMHMYSYTCSAMRKNSITKNRKLCSPIVNLNVEWKSLSVNLTRIPVLSTSPSPISSILNQRSYERVLAMLSSKINHWMTTGCGQEEIGSGQE